jgi:hypothetical protein
MATGKEAGTTDRSKVACTLLSMRKVADISTVAKQYVLVDQAKRLLSAETKHGVLRQRGL